MASESFTAIFDAQDNLSGVFDNMASGGKSVENVLGSLAKKAATFFAAKKVVDFGKECISTARNFESGMAEVFTLLPDISSDAMIDMRADVKDFVKETGADLSDATSALYQAISAGVDQNDAINFLKTANKAAVGGVSDLETAVDGLTSVTNAYGLNVLSTERASDLMFTTVKLGKTTFNELSSSLYNVIPTAVGAGVSFDDVSAALAAMTAQGIPTSSATVKLRQAITELSQTGTDTDKIFRKLAGKSFKDFIAGGGNLQKALQLLETHAEKSKLGIDDLFSSTQAGSAALALTGSGTEKFTQAVKGMADAAGATDAAYEMMENTSEHKLKKMQAEWEVMKVDIGGALSEALMPAMDALSENMPEITEAMSEFGTLMVAAVEAAVPAFKALVDNIGLVKAAIVGLGTLKLTSGAAGTINTISKLFGITTGAGIFGGTVSGGVVTSSLGAVATAAGPAALGIAAVTAALIAAEDVSEKSNYHFADKINDGLDEALEKAQPLEDYIKNMNELDKIKLTLEDPESTKEELESAKKRLEEIADLCGVDYKVKIDTEGNITGAEETVNDIANTYNDTAAPASRDTYRAALDSINDFTNQKNIEKYKNNAKAIDVNTESLAAYKKQIEDCTAGLDAYNRAADNFDSGLIDAATYNQQASDAMERMYGKGKSYSSLHKDWDESQLTAAYKNFFSNVIPGMMKGAELEMPTIEKELANNKYAVEEYEKASSKAKQTLTELLAADVHFGDTANIAADVQLFENYGRVIKEIGHSTDEAALAYATAKSGYTDFSAAIADGKVQEVTQAFLDYKQSIGETAENAIQGAALIKNGFADVTAATAAGSDAVSAVINDIRSLGNMSGVFDGLDTTGIASKLTEISQAMGLIPENKVVNITAEGDIEVTDFLDLGKGPVQVPVDVKPQINTDLFNNNNIFGGNIVAPQISVTADTSAADTGIQTVKGALINLTNEPAEPTITADDQASATIAAVSQSLDSLNAKTATPTITVAYKTSGSPPKEKATGTSYFEGGLTYVNDQKGISDPTELIYQNGKLFSYDGNDVLTYLERGAKIIKASETASILNGNLDLLKRRIGESNYSHLDLLSESFYGSHSLIPEYPAYANGTMSSEDAFIAGEEGPELILGKQGSTVFPTRETQKILNSFDDDDYRIPPPKNDDSKSSDDGGGKKFVIEINGNGSVKTDNKEQIMEYVMQQIKPVLIDIFEEEIYEEGDGSRDF